MKNLLRKVTLALAMLMCLVACPMKTVQAENILLEFTKNIVIGTTIEDTLTNANGKYNFKLNRSGTLTVQIGFKEGSGYSWGYHGGITLYDCDGDRIANAGVRDNTGGTDSAVFTVDVLAGDYYFIVDGKGTSNYIITTSYVDSGETVVDSLLYTHDSQANPISLPLMKKYTGHIADNSVSDVYKVVMNKSQMLKINVTNRTNGINLAIINTNNTVNAQYQITEKAGTVKLFCPKGTYYITMSKYADCGSYTISTSASVLAKTKITRLKNVKGKYMSVKFQLKSLESAAGYHIQYSTDKKFKKGKKNVYISNSDYLRSTQTIYVGKKKTYYVRIRTYMEDNRGDQYYSEWSSAKKIIIKK